MRPTIYLIGRSINDDKTVNVHAHINEQDKDILPGMFVNARIETSDNQAPCLSDESIVQSDGKNYIYVFVGKTKNQLVYNFKMVEIKPGVSQGGFTQLALPENMDIYSVSIAIKGA